MLGTTGPASALALQRLSDAAGVSLTYVREMSGDAYVLGLPSPMPLPEVQAIADRISALPEVQYAEPDAIMQHTLTPNDPQYGNQWHYFAPGAGQYGINAPAAWDITTGSASIVVAVIDTGITNHADLAGRSVPGLGYDFITNVASANDGNGRDSDPSDPGDWVTANECFAGSSASNSSWHGTHVAGTIGAASNNGMGVAGVNWSSRIVSARVLGKCGGTISDIADGMRWSAGLAVAGVPANANPAKVLNLSLGGSGACGTTYQDAINAIVAAGATVVISAGNSNADASGFRPANCNGVITVAATNRNGSRSYYSNYGATVEISAPGGETNVSSSNGVLSTLNTGTQGPLADKYAYYQGTSMAAPHVAGVASLMLSRNPWLTPAQVLSLMQSTATAFPGGSSCTPSLCGSGIVNAGAAVAAVPDPPVLNKKLYLPLVLNGYPPIPAAPLLNAIANGDGDGNYTVSWNASATATGYLLQEDDNAAFSSPETRYSGAGTSWDATAKAVGTYYYRAQASNTWGASGWSNVVSVVVQPPSSGPTPGFWQQPGGAMEFYVTADRGFVDDFAIYINVTGCGSYKITHTIPEPISSNSFSWSGPFYASGTFSSQTAAGGTTGLSSFPISGCGLVSGGPYAWSAGWVSGLAMSVEAAEANLVESADMGDAFEVTRIP
ncbi:MAG: S8 family peptidase [Anaerolineae bacterium]|nr:S8 family peptidase [Anaerolineae bacterium]